MLNYKTIAEEAEAEYIVKKSRFIGYASPVKSQQEAVGFIERIRSKHWDATHNVYAYILSDGNISRYSDDGEPQGTAGIPTLEVLKKEKLTDLVVVVTRYFGGIMLGAGGLVRAYSHSAKLAVDAAGIVLMKKCACCSCCVDYNFYGRLSPLLYSHGARIEKTDFGSDVTVDFSIGIEDLSSLNEDVIDLSNGRFSVRQTGERFLPFDVK